MALKCEHCGRGKVAGHAVSHAKNRTPRFFKPNLQKLKVMIDGMVRRAKLCTRCIKRMHKDGRIGKYYLIKQVIKPVKPVRVEVSKKKLMEAEKKEKEVKVIKPEKAEKPQKAVPTLDIASIVGKKE